MAVSRPEEKISSLAKSWTLMLRNPKAEGKKDSTPKGSGPLGMCDGEGEEIGSLLLLRQNVGDFNSCHFSTPLAFVPEHKRVLPIGLEPI